jgi:hypothetical protein
MPALREAIWEWMYRSHVVLDHLPFFIMVESDAPFNFNAMAPEARIEWLPMRDKS